MIRTARVIIGGMTLVFVLAVAGAGAFSAAATKRAAACRNDGSAMAHLSATQVRTAVVCLINQERTRFGLPPVTENAQLDHAAQGHVTDMVKRDYFAHNAPGANGSTPQQRITAAGYTWGAWGENIAAGYPTALSTVTAWMRDGSHCANVLFPAFAEVGIGFANKTLPGISSAPGLWTGNFGLKLGKTPPSTNQKPYKGCPYGF